MRCLYLLFLGLLLAALNIVTADGCSSGFLKEGNECKDDDECTYDSPICGDNATCHNTNGSYYCLCEKGYWAEKTHKVNFTQDKGGKCVDINECSENENICGLNAECTNVVGSYYCTCNPGFVSSTGQDRFNAGQNVTCKDVNECLKKASCGPNAKCINTNGSYHCTCNPGFVSSTGQDRFNAGQNVTCKDVNECLKKASCGPNAKCINTNGSYHCTCNPGFVSSIEQDHFNAGQNVTCKENKCLKNTTCGPHANCTNKNGSYFCMCHSGFVASSMEENYADPGVKCNELQCDRLKTENLTVQFLENILKELKSKCMEKGVAAEGMLQILLEALGSFLSNTPLTDSKMITALFELVENTLPLVGQLQVKHNISATLPQTRLEMLVKRGPSAPDGALCLSTSKVKFNSLWETAAGKPYQGFASASLFEYNSLKSPQNSAYFDEAKKIKDEVELISKVVTIAVTNPNTTHLKEPITLNFTHLQEAKRTTTCVFWDSKLNGGAWSTRGCKVEQTSISHTVCSCSHLSSFAVLMALYELDDVFELQLITWIGLSLSLVCLLICILTFWLVRSIQSTRNTIHLHLCISLFIADFIFLVGISQTDNKVGCGVVAGLLHFFFLAVFCWMCLEGVQLFRMVVLVFNTTLSRVYLMAGGYGIPALIVIISASINYKGYGTPRYCWLSLENGFIWSFFGPVCIIIVVNAVFFLITVSKLAQKFNSLNPDFNSLRKIKAFTITAIAQLCVLGTMWIFGCFQFDKEMLVMSYVFTILNSLQGVLVFITHCLLSKQVRDEYIRFLTCVTIQQKSSYSEFSTNQSSKSQMSKSVHNTGESKI